jgi:hypothetical protein
MNMVRFHGIFAPRSKARPSLKSLLPPRSVLNVAEGGENNLLQQSANGGSDDAPPAGSVPPRYRRPWHELLKRIFDLSVLVCPRCGSSMRRISHIEEPQTIVRILDHLGLPSEMPPIAPARAPPQQELDFVDLDELASEAPEGL